MDAFSELRIRVRNSLKMQLELDEPGLPDHEVRMRVREMMDDISADEMVGIYSESSAAA